MPRRRSLDPSILDICLALCDEQIAKLQKQRADLIAERDRDSRRDRATRPTRPPRATPKPTAA